MLIGQKANPHSVLVDAQVRTIPYDDKRDRTGCKPFFQKFEEALSIPVATEQAVGRIFAEHPDPIPLEEGLKLIHNLRLSRTPDAMRGKGGKFNGILRMGIIEKTRFSSGTP